ncbi:lipase/acyltransferase domain-containing protein [Macrococcoides caseolyticum]|uniref:lipase/acyltransferase domain-containing protein n=1 Tax=Macrococcoides caseolyticum TaxID=69966 RepID=UPI001F38A16F|nr:alpha/beta hydrolase [Macrococcus caseolyticus]MCE4955960.1 alpha/beta hydrolase [Macrococcus caseolyticus]
MKHIVFVHSAGVQSVTSGSNPLIRVTKERVPEYHWHTSDYPRDAGQIYDNWVKVFIKSLEEVPVSEPVILIGHSFGGTVITKYLTENQVDHTIEKVIMIGAPFFGCDEKFSDTQNMITGALKVAVPLYHIQSIDDDRVDINHQTCWKEAFPEIQLITEQQGKHEFHDGIQDLNELLQ